MDEYTVTEQAYKNGYNDGYKANTFERKKLKSEIAKEIIEEIRRRAKPSRDFLSQDIGRGYSWAVSDFFKVLIEVENKYVEDCSSCKHFVGCECFDGKTCDSFVKSDMEE